MATFVLVHGAFQGGWVWREVAAALRGRGHEVFAPTLSGCGHLHHGAREGLGLHAYVQDVDGLLQFEGLDQAVLVAHSYSGMICGAAMMRAAHLLRRAVFVDALIPDSNASFADVAGEAFRHMLEAHRVNGWRVRPWPLPVFGAPPERAAWFAQRLCDFPLAAFTAPFPGEFDPSAVETSFIACRHTASPFIRAMAGKAAKLGWPVAELDSAHCPMLACPAALADLLHEQA